MGQSPECTERTVKYIANKPAKNISSLESHTMVPTLTMFGLVSECTLLDSKRGVVAVEVTIALLPHAPAHFALGWVVLPGSDRYHPRPTNIGPEHPSHRGNEARRMALGNGSGDVGTPAGATVLVYSNSDAVRAQIRTAVGRRPAPDLGRIEWVECSTNAQVVAELDQGGIELAILDGEAQPTGGMGLTRQFKNELLDCPPMVVLIARPQDEWLATWSLADAVINTPIDPVEAAGVVAETLRSRASTIPVVR
jgi:hypothetical protein